MTIINKAITYFGALEVIRNILFGSNNLNTNFIIEIF
tara:strand:+ start:295 stop:405 length:111 start_codon:yes stop_codon:yes gene_type:complete